MRGKLALKVGLVILAVTLCGTFSPESPAASTIIQRRAVVVQAPRWLRCDRGGHG